MLQANEVLREQQGAIDALARDRDALARERDLARQQAAVLIEEMDRERVHARHQIQAVISAKDALLVEKENALSAALVEKESALSLYAVAQDDVQEVRAAIQFQQQQHQNLQTQFLRARERSASSTPHAALVNAGGPLAPGSLLHSDAPSPSL
jgi:two-component sensor histidine kinase